jgi:guanylate kinase
MADEMSASQKAGAEDPYGRVGRQNPLLIVISGPSGVGKDATVKRMKELGLPFHFVVTATTRPPRPDERDGVDYHFLSVERFEQMLADNELLEHAMVYGQHKGIPKFEVRDALASGLDVVMRIDVQGAATIRRVVPGAVLIFLMASSEEELIGRLKQRDTEDEEELRRRIETARHEMSRLNEFDYVIVNSHCHLDQTVEQIQAIIRAEKCRVEPRQITL